MTGQPTTQPDRPPPDPHAGQGTAGRPWYVSALLALVAVTLLLGGAALFARARSPYPFYGTAYPNPPVAAAFSGTGADGQPYAFRPDGKTSALFFGFTHCPNICPVTLAYLNQMQAKLTPAEREKFRVVLVSVDPQRDTPKLLGEYLDYFGGGDAVNIPEPRLSEVAGAYGVGYRRSEVKSPQDYQVDHTTATYLIDSSGRLRLLWDYTQLGQLDRVLADVRYVMEHPLEQGR